MLILCNKNATLFIYTSAYAQILCVTSIPSLQAVVLLSLKATTKNANAAGVRTWIAYINLFENFDVGFWWIGIPLRFAVGVGILRFCKSWKSVNHFIGQVVIFLRKRSQGIPKQAERIPKVAGMERRVNAPCLSRNDIAKTRDLLSNSPRLFFVYKKISPLNANLCAYIINQHSFRLSTGLLNYFVFWMVLFVR